MIRHYGNQYGVDPYLVYCVMHQESRFSSTATSHAGAQGLMQLMPGTAARYGVTNSYDPAQNIQAGTRYLRDLLRLFDGRVDPRSRLQPVEGAVMKTAQGSALQRDARTTSAPRHALRLRPPPDEQELRADDAEARQGQVTFTANIFRDGRGLNNSRPSFFSRRRSRDCLPAARPRIHTRAKNC